MSEELENQENEMIEEVEDVMGEGHSEYKISDGKGDEVFHLSGMFRTWFLDQNLAKYMVEEQQKEIEANQKVIEEQRREITEKNNQIEEKDAQLEEKDTQLERLRKELEKYRKLE